MLHGLGGVNVERIDPHSPLVLRSASQSSIGPQSARLVQTIMAERPHPEQGFRACLGILRLGKRFGEDRLEKACARALAIKSHAYRTVESILKNHLEQAPIPAAPAALPFHGNIRGSSYYH